MRTPFPRKDALIVTVAKERRRLCTGSLSGELTSAQSAVIVRALTYEELYALCLTTK